MNNKEYRKLLAIHKNPYDLILIKKHETPLESINELYDNFKKVPNISRYIEGRLFPSTLNQLNGTISNHFVDLEKDLVWFTSILKAHSEQISSFNKYRAIYTNLIFNNEIEEALKILGEIEKNTGLSLWLLENKIKLLQKTQGISKHKSYLQAIIQNRNVSEIFKIILHFRSMSFEDIFSPEKYEQEVHKYVDALFENHPDAVGRSYFIDRLCLMIPEFKNEAFKLRMDNSFPLIDRYIEFTKYFFSLKEKGEISDVTLEIIDRNLKSIYEDPHTSDTKCNSEILSEEKIKIIEILDYYSIGDYNQVVEEAFKLISKNPTLIELYDPFLKSCIYLNRQNEFNSETLLGKIFDKLENIYKNKASISINVQPLLKICYENIQEIWSWKLYSYITNLIEPANTNFKNQVSRIGFKLYLLPKAQIFKGIYTNEVATKIILNLEKSVPYSPTLQLHSLFLSADISGLKSLNLPKDRELKYMAAIQFSTNNLYEAIENYELLLEKAHEIHHFEIYSALAKCYLHVLELNKLSKIICNHSLQDISIITKEDFEKIIILLDEQTYDKSLIDIPILYHYYSKNISNKKDYLLTDIYEDFLYHLNSSRPSELDVSKYIDNNDKLVFFLEKICSIDTMSKSIEFNNISEVEEERIKICNLLKQINSINNDEYDKEIQEITRRMTLKQITRVIDSNKIYVDETGVKKVLLKNIVEDFSRFESIQGFNNDKLEQYISLNNFSNVKFVPIFINEKWSIFVELVKQIRNEFVYNKNYGLNGYLSVNIRHGSLIGHLRRELERKHLITQIDSLNKKYSPNTYWLEKISTSDEHKTILQEKLDLFSYCYDTKIAQLKDEYIQIKTEENRDSLGLFNYSLYSSVLRSLYYDVLRMDNIDLEEFISLIISHLWDITERNLAGIRKFLNSEFRAAINSYFEELLYNLEPIGKSIKLLELTNKIVEVKTQTNREIDTLISWFIKNKDYEIDNFVLNLPIEIAFKSSKNMNINIVSQIDFNDLLGGDFKFHGRFLNPFVTLFTNLFDNAMKRSGFESVDIYVEFKIINYVLEIKVTNKVNLDKIPLEERLIKIDESKTKLDIESKNIDFISTEGGSGLPKLLKLTRIDLGCEGKLDFNIIDDIFQVDLKINIKELLV